MERSKNTLHTKRNRHIRISRRTSKKRPKKEVIKKMNKTEYLEESLIEMIEVFEKTGIYSFKVSNKTRRKLVKKLIKIKGNEDYIMDRQEEDW